MVIDSTVAVARVDTGNVSDDGLDCTSTPFPSARHDTFTNIKRDSLHMTCTKGAALARTTRLKRSEHKQPTMRRLKRIFCGLQRCRLP